MQGPAYSGSTDSGRLILSRFVSSFNFFTRLFYFVFFDSGLGMMVNLFVRRLRRYRNLVTGFGFVVVMVIFDIA